MPIDPVETLQRLIRTPSINPMGRETTDATFGERRLTELLQAICVEHGWHWLRQRVHPDRDNLIILMEGYPAATEGGEFILWDVHQDTVAIEGMTVDPFGGELRNGRVYGRGASDVKGSLAAMLAGLSRLTDNTSQRRPTIVLACTVNEEYGFSGAKSLSTLWPRATGIQTTTNRTDLVAGSATLDRLFPRTPDAAIVAEPTNLNVVVAHQGVVRWRCHTLGRAAHSSRPDEGVNAIYAMSRVVGAIEQFHRKLTNTGPEHPLCGRPSVCVSTIHGGVGINTVPEQATIEIDRRLGPSERPDVAFQQLVDHLAAHVDLGGCQIRHDPPFMQSVGLSDASNRPVAERLTEIVLSAGRSSESIGVPFGTDAAAIAAGGVPTVVFGPGSITQAHTADEFIEVAEVELATEIFFRIAQNGLH